MHVLSGCGLCDERSKVISKLMAAGLLAAACRNRNLLKAGEIYRWCMYGGSRFFSTGGKIRLGLSTGLFRPFAMSGVSLTHSVHVSL